MPGPNRYPGLNRYGTVADTLNCDSAIGSEMARANAYLIAAAPELYEACEDAPDPDQLGIAGAEAFAAHYREWYEQRRAAVLKAEGGTN